MPRAAFVYTDAYVSYHLADAHPLQQKRLLMTHRLLDALGAFDGRGLDLIVPTPATEDDLRCVHSPDYLSALQTLSAGGRVGDARRFGFGTLDNPAFRGMWEASLLYAGGSLDCARLVQRAGYRAAFNVSGGLHHAQRDRAAGFCTVNDCALVAHDLLAEGASRVAYVDIDAHHGDGVQALFYGDPRVLTLSLHETPESIFPRVTGFAHEIGEDAGTGFNANLPLLAGTGDRVALDAFDATFLPLLRAFDPDFVILQVGADAHFGDPLAHLSLTTRGWLALAQSVLDLGKPTIALGGGGYNLKTVARLWTLLGGALSGQTLSEDVPGAYADEWDIHALHDRTQPPIPSHTMRATQEYATRGVQTVQDLVFPFHGLRRPRGHGR